MPFARLLTIGRQAARSFEVPCIAIIAIAMLGIPSLAVAQQGSASDGQASDSQASGGNGVKVIDQSSSAAAKAKGEINFDDLKFDIDKDAAFAPQMLSEDVKDLNGKKVKLRGYILPATLFKEKGIDQFVLVRDNQECCFGPGAALFDCVMIQMMPGRTTDFVTRPVTVEGKFKIDTETYKYPAGVGPKGATHLAIFQIDGMSVK